MTRGILSRKLLSWRCDRDPKVSFPDCCAWISHLYNISDNTEVSPGELEKYRFANQMALPKKKESIAICTLDKFLSETKESVYFLKRGFSSEVLETFYVRSCLRHNRYFSGRSLVPLFDVANRDVLGISGRSESDEITPKWLHSKHYPSGNSLYGLGQAQEFIRTAKSAIIVEGPADVWKLVEAGIYNVVGLNGLNLTPVKHHILDKLGVMNITLCLDNDKAGREATEKIAEQVGRLYNIRVAKLPLGVKDVGELNSFQVKEVFK